ncbi:aspartyl-phosphate phosphatase Spo0E family protein [Aquibacillus albus]|uniref:Spo0E family sporulation regulatory protein-aspartic acid phosphatase n=1 Tax=Aquibacillus albus TaxID=1168171 RepID=A0ABS2N350_9BACI|nr:aspartyl-phosphate phosphatase Spo0E family protein [Aquibacillus albus]MBM7572561.1 hypothetical protein [Aquibacillus albus]
MFKEQTYPLDLAIQKKREEMIEVGLKKGLNHNETVLISQQLDQLLNDIQKLKHTNQ